MLQTPEIFTVSSFKLQAVSTTSTSPTEIHTYHAGDKVAFSVYIKGPPSIKPQNIKSYTISAYAKEKSGTTRGNPNDNLKPIEVKVLDIIASTNTLDLLKNPPPLTVSVIKQDEKGKFDGATGSPFNLKLPDTRYLGNTSGKIQLISAPTDQAYIPENACSATDDKICGSNSLNVSNCLAYKCWKYSKGSQIVKDCCKGLVRSSSTITQGSSSSSSSSGSSSGTSQTPSPSCNKDTKQIECKSTNIFYVPYCKKRFVPDCLSSANVSSSSSSSGNNSSGSSSSGNSSSSSSPICKPFPAESSSSSSSGSAEEPTCVPIDKAAQMYCDEVSNLPYDSRFSTSDYVNNFCENISDPEEKKGCCAGCGAIYDKITGSKDISGEENGIKSCIDFNTDGGLCESFKRAETCVQESCYKEQYGSDELKACCLKNDKEATQIHKLLKDALLSEDTGMIYNIVTFGNNAAQTSVRIQKSVDDILAQNFELNLPNDPDIDSVIIKVACEDTQGKIYNSESNIVLIPGETETTIAKENNKTGACVQPAISSLKVNNGGSITVLKNEPVEIPLIITDAELDLSSVKVTGLSSDFKSEELNKSAGYNFTVIKGTPKSSGTFTVTATAQDNCKPTKFTFDISVTDTPPPETITDLTTVWLPKVPFIGAELLRSLLKEQGMTYTKVKYDLPRAIVAGSKTSLEIPSQINIANINPSKLKVTWISSTNRIKVPPSTIKQLSNGKIKLITFVDKDEPEGIAKVILSNTEDIKSAIAQTEVNIIKSQGFTKIKGKVFNKPIVETYKIKQDPSNPDDPLSFKIMITGENFIGRRARINNKKVIIPKKVVPGQVSRFTYAEFRNSNITINKIRTKDNNSTLIIKLRLPEDYKGGREELFISTPVGQTFTEIQFPTAVEGFKKKQKSLN